MIELRWKINKWIEHDDYGYPTTKTEGPVLQYKVLFHPVMGAGGDITLQAYDFADWIDVPKEYVEV